MDGRAGGLPFNHGAPGGLPNHNSDANDYA